MEIMAPSFESFMIATTFSSLPVAEPVTSARRIELFDPPPFPLLSPPPFRCPPSIRPSRRLTADHLHLT